MIVGYVYPGQLIQMLGSTASVVNIAIHSIQKAKSDQLFRFPYI